MAFTLMPAVRDALKTLLGANAAGRYRVEGYRKQSHGAEEIVGAGRHVMVFYRQGAFDKAKSGWLQGPFRHAMTFGVEIALAAPAKADLRVLQDATASPQAFMSALAAMQEAAGNADALMDELAGILYGILMDPRNMIAATADRWISSLTKDHPAPRGEYVLLTGTMDYTCSGNETVSGDVGVPLTQGIDITLTETANPSGAPLDPAAQGGRSS